MTVPKLKQTFLTDQREIRNMHIWELNKKVSKANKRKHDRKNQLLERKEEEKRRRFKREKKLLLSDSELYLLLTLMLLVVAVVIVATFSGKDFLIYCSKTGM